MEGLPLLCKGSSFSMLFLYCLLVLLAVFLHGVVDSSVLCFATATVLRRMTTKP